MSDNRSAAQEESKGADADVLAVRSLIETTRADPGEEVAAVNEASASETRGVAARPGAADRRPGGDLVAWLLARVRAYRPERRAVLVTSAVLLLLLQPVFVIGWGVLLGILFVAFYLIVGEERFWKGVISQFRRYARRRPDAARRLKVRAWVLSRRWDRYTGILPDAVADMLRSPDLRAMIVADQKHAAALSERLNRLSHEPSR
ncbi:hypothetical protein [Roseobacter ponti]|uniref:Uncharacterized protein n=1 Tax=Roseobacter ponti TaxID=1891787 RepID=A0A858SQ97_9RHOB|nr:hypothetical protein [Roseobacter ponti]QJF50167.1 hypothetical protein G3256_02795 [Roseobacter ponti]